MSHEPHAAPPIPFTEAETVAMRTEDVKAGKAIGVLTSSIFIAGGCIYLFVLVWTLLSTPNYAVR